MSKELGPFLPLYVDDLIGGTMHFGAEEFGAYILLLTHQWQTGQIEDNPKVIERVARCEYGHLTRVLCKFTKRGDVLQNDRMQQVRDARIAFMAKQRANGQLGGRPKENPVDSPNDNPNIPPAETSPFPSPFPYPSAPPLAKIKNSCSPMASDVDFQTLWKAYPKKVGKAAAYRAWVKSKRDRPPVADILTKIAALKSCDQWTRDGGQFIPYPATWINRGGWHDEVQVTVEQRKKSSFGRATI